MSKSPKIPKVGYLAVGVGWDPQNLQREMNAYWLSDLRRTPEASLGCFDMRPAAIWLVVRGKVQWLIKTVQDED